VPSGQASLLADNPERLSPDGVLRIAIAGLLGLMFISGVVYALFGVSLLEGLSLLPSCPFRAAIGFPCPGCGMTRAFLFLSQLRVGEAISSNPAAPLLAAVMLWRMVHPRRWGVRNVEALAGVLLVVMVCAWIVRGTGV
jgi:hypothetical protein